VIVVGGNLKVGEDIIKVIMMRKEIFIVQDAIEKGM